MAELYFKVKADYDKVVRLREEIAKLETQLKNVSTTTPKAEIDKLQNNLSRAKEEFNGITTAAAKAAASMGGDFKTKIKEATTTINDLSGKIIEQKAVIKDVEADVRRLGEAYRNSMKGGKGGSAEKKADYLSAKKALQEEKAALFALTQQQSKAKLSLKELNDEYKEFKEGSEDNADIFDELKNKLMGVGTVIAGGIGVKEFVGKMIQVRGEFQAMETALQTMLGSKEKADELLAKVKEYAKISPLELSSVSNATKMMLGFNIEAEKIPTYLKAIGDVSMGDAGKFNSLTLAFSQMSAAGKLMGQDLLQMVNAGFNPLSVISEQTGKSIGQLREEMSKGAISAEMIQKAFIDATSAGGKFYNMSENAAKTINGQISMMQDAIDAAFNEMGQASEGVIMGAIKGVTSVIENYQTLGKVVAAAAATYGVYKAAVLATIAVEKIHAVSRMAAIAHTTTLSMATDVLAKKLGLVNLVAKANPYVLLATAIAGVVAAMWAFYSSTNEAEKANKAFEESMNRVTQKTDELKSKTDSLIKTMEDVSIAEGIRKDSFLELKMLYPDILSDIKSENEFLAKKHELLQLINGEQGKRTRLTIEDEIRKFEADLKHYQHVLNTGTSTSLVDMDGNGWATDNVVDAIRETKNNVNKAKAELAQTYIPDMLSEIKDLDTEVLNSRLEETTNILTALGESSQDAIGLLSFGDVSEYSKGQISKINQALKGEIGNRNSEKKSHTEWLQSLYDTYNKAQKALDDFYKKKDKMSKDDWQKENDKLKKERDAAKQAYENAGGKTKAGTTTTKKDEVDEEEEEAKIRLKEMNADKESKRLLEKYRGYLEQRKALELQYDVDRVNLIFGGASDEALAENEYQKQKALEDLDQSFAQREDEFNGWANSIINLSVEKLRELLSIAEEELAKMEALDPNNENLAVARAKVNTLNKQISKAENKAEDKNEDTADDSVKKWKDLSEVLSQVKGEFEEIGNIVGGTGGAILSLIGEIGTFVTSTIDTIETMTTAAANSIKATEKASMILSILSGAMKILTEISNLIGDRFSQYQAYAAKIDEINQLRDAVNDYKMAMIEARHEEENWFADDNLKRLKDYKEIQSQALKNYKDKLEETQAIYQNVGGGGWLTDLWKPVTEMIDASFGKIYGFEINKDYQKGTTAAANNLRIETRKASKGFLGTGIGGKSQKTEDLQAWINANKDLFKGLNTELFDENGMINEELTREILDKYGNKLVGQTGATLEALLEYKEQYDAYLEELRNYVSSLYEPLIDNMVDSLWDWLDEGKDALDSFKSYASDTFRDIVSDMMRTIILEKVVGSFSDDIADLYEQYATGKMTEEELAQGIANRTQGFVEDYETNIPVLQKILEQIKEYLAAAGIDITGSSTTSQEASRRGFGTEMTHEDAGELSGRFTALQLAGEEIKSQAIAQTQSLNLLTMRAENLLALNQGMHMIADDIRTQIANSYLELVGIRENTSAIVKPIIQMQRDMAEVKENTKNL